MDIDIERLETDAAYWDEVAPEGATHYIIDHDAEGGMPPSFHKDEGDKYRECVSNDYWMKGSPSPLEVIPRPQKPEVEWDGSEIVKAGHRLEARADGSPWLRGEITYRSEEGVVFRPDDGGCELFWRFCMFHVEFRPIRTKDQRQVEQICDAMRDTDIPLTGENQECLARAILSRYNLEPKDV